MTTTIYDAAIYDAADVILPIITSNHDLMIFQLPFARCKYWKKIIDKLFSANPNIFKWKLKMRKLLNMLRTSPLVIPTIELTLLEYYIWRITHISKLNVINYTTMLTKNQCKIIKYFLFKGAIATINVSQIIDHQMQNSITLYYDHFSSNSCVLIGKILKILMNPYYQNRLIINFDISFEDVLKCIDVDLLEVYLNTIVPNPKSLSLNGVIKWVGQRFHVRKQITDDHVSETEEISDISQRYIDNLKKLLEYGVIFDFDILVRKIETKYYVNNILIMFLLEQRQKEFTKRTKIMMEHDCMFELPEELIAKIVDMSLPMIIH